MKARCDEQDPSSGGYGTRCIRREGHDGDHRDAFGDLWPNPEPDVFEAKVEAWRDRLEESGYPLDLPPEPHDSGAERG